MPKLLLLLLTAFPLGACGLQPAGRSDAPPPAATPAALAVPLAGDAAAGRQAFLDLKCTTCHTVPSEPGFPAPVSEIPAPALDGRLARSLPSYLVTAIVSPSHELSNKTSDAVRARFAGTLSPMGDFSRVMTVRQLVDVHAFIVSLK
jgi:hypothetical protein